MLFLISIFLTRSLVTAANMVPLSDSSVSRGSMTTVVSSSSRTTAGLTSKKGYTDGCEPITESLPDLRSLVFTLNAHLSHRSNLFYASKPARYEENPARYGV